MNPELRTHLDRLYVANDKIKELNTGMADTVRVAIAKATWKITMAHAEMEEALKEVDELHKFRCGNVITTRREDWDKIDYPNNIDY